MYSSDSLIPAQKLEGLSLPNGWTVLPEVEAVVRESKGNQINLNDNLLFKKLDKIIKDSPEIFASKKEQEFNF